MLKRWTCELLPEDVRDRNATLGDVGRSGGSTLAEDAACGTAQLSIAPEYVKVRNRQQRKS